MRPLSSITVVVARRRSLGLFGRQQPVSGRDALTCMSARRPGMFFLVFEGSGSGGSSRRFGVGEFRGRVCDSCSRLRRGGGCSLAWFTGGGGGGGRLIYGRWRGWG